jgi:tripeptide aminopeptidase
MKTLTLHEDRAIARLLRFLSIEGVTGHEEAIGREVRAALLEVGVPPRAITFDRANEQIPLPTQTGNLIVTLSGTRAGPRRLFSTHLDTVPLCAGAQPKRQGGRIVAAGQTALGGDNRTGVGCLVTLAAELIAQGLPHPPLTLLFTVREESGLWGARYAEPDDLGNPVVGFNVDGRSPYEVTVGAVGAERWQAEIIGRAAHAGVHPERGVSATVIASLALADVYREGWFGKIKKGKLTGTSNLGVFGGKDKQSAGDADLRTWVTFLSEDQPKLDPQLVRWSQKHGLKSVPVGVFEDNDGPPSYRLASDADITVLFFVKRKVVANFAFRAGELTDEAAAEVMKALPRIIETKP